MAWLETCDSSLPVWALELAVTDTLPEPLSFSYEPAVGLLRALPLPTLRRGRMAEGVKPDACVRDLLRREPDAADHGTLGSLRLMLTHHQERPRSAISMGPARLLLRGAAALDLRGPAEWRARDVASFCRKLAEAPREVARMVYFPPSAASNPQLATRCKLCFDLVHIVWRCHWTDTRMALRRLGQGPLCGNCVESIQ